MGEKKNTVQLSSLQVLNILWIYDSAPGYLSSESLQEIRVEVGSKIWSSKENWRVESELTIFPETKLKCQFSFEKAMLRLLEHETSISEDNSNMPDKKLFMINYFLVSSLENCRLP